MPINIIINMFNGVNEAKFDTVDENMYFNPLKLNNDSTVTRFWLYDFVTKFTVE